MGSKTILSSNEISDEDMGVLSSLIGMAAAFACIVYSYTLNAKQILDKVKKNMSTIVVGGEAIFVRCLFHDGKLYDEDGEYLMWAYDLIESAEDNFGALIFYSVPVKNMALDKPSRIKYYLQAKLALEDCAIDWIDIPQKSKPYEDNGFSFSHHELADAFRKSVIIKPPYRTTLNGLTRKEAPIWYVAGRTGKGTAPSTAKERDSGGCYIATSVYGSYDCPEVWVLRRFRDHSLARSVQGRLFIRLYYTVSPVFVRFFGNTAWFRRFWKGKLDKIVQELGKKGYMDTPYFD